MIETLNPIVEDEFLIEEDLESLNRSNEHLEIPDNVVDDNAVDESAKNMTLRAIRVLGESATSSTNSGSSTPLSNDNDNSRTNSPRSRGRGRGSRGSRTVRNGLKRSTALGRRTSNRKAENNEDDCALVVKQLAQQISSNGGDLSSLEGSPRFSPKVLMSNYVDDLNTMPETKAEIKKRLASFEHIQHNVFLCARLKNKTSMSMECDCDVKDLKKAGGLKKGCGETCINRQLMMECPETCSLGSSCSNKRFQNIENAGVEVFKTAYKGVGLRTTAEIPGETFIMEYVGEVLDETKFRKRAKKYSKDDAQHFYFMALSADQVIDASNRGNISRFINHSCNPNAETQKWTVNGELRIGFFSKRTIGKSEEITFDYKYERYGQEAQKCYCGAENCRGWLGGNPEDDKDSDEEESEEESESSQEESSEEEEEVEIVEKKLPEKVVDKMDTSEETIETVVKPNIVTPTSAPQVAQAKPQQTQSTAVAPAPPKIRRKYRRRRSPRKIKNFEADDYYEEDLDKLKSTGIRTKDHTLDLCRRMLKAIDLNVKLILCELLRNADPPCRRLFIDYRGLHTFGHWVTDLQGQSQLELNLMESVEDALAVLIIPDKQVLTDTKLWQTITRWTEMQITEEKSIQQTLADQADVGKTQLEDVKNNDQLEAIQRKAPAEIQRKSIRDKAAAILENWSQLQEVKFKIPKNVRADQRAQHERELEAASSSEAKSEAAEMSHNIESIYQNKHAKPWSYYEHVPMVPTMVETPPLATSEQLMVNNITKPQMQSQPIQRKRPRPSRFDDETGELHNPRIERNALRLLFQQKAKKENDERVRRDCLKRLHIHKCSYLRLQPETTPLFPQFPEYYYVPEERSWRELPPFLEHGFRLPDFHPHNYPRMANMPVEAFKVSDEPLPNPANIYPPGVVAISYLFGCPTSLDPQYNEFGRRQVAEQSNMPLTFVDPETGIEQPIPELNDEEKVKALEYIEEQKHEQYLLRQQPLRAPSLDDDEDDYDAELLATAAASATANLAARNAKDVSIPFLTSSMPDESVEENIRNLLDLDVPLPIKDQPSNSMVPAQPTVQMASSSNANEVRIKLPPHWRTARDEDGRLYFYNRRTNEVSWDPPTTSPSEADNVVVLKERVMDVETASPASENDEDENNDGEEDGEDTDDEEEDEDMSEEKGLDPAIIESSETIVSDLSEEEKEQLLKNSRKKSKEERQNERRQKREQNREKREYEKKRRRERHGKHRRDGLVQEYFIPVSIFEMVKPVSTRSACISVLICSCLFQRRTEKEKAELMTFEEMRSRLANRDAIREKQEQEERAEEEREMEELAKQRKEAALERKRLLQQESEKSKQSVVNSTTIAAAADTSSEQERKFKAGFLKETSKVVVKILEEYRREDVAKIKSKEDFKNLAKKVSLENLILLKYHWIHFLHCS